MIESLGKGAAIGAGLGSTASLGKAAAEIGLSKAAKKVFGKEGVRKAAKKVLGKDAEAALKNLDDLKANRAKLQSKIEAEKLANASPARIDKLNGALLDATQKYKEGQYNLAKNVFTKSITSGIGNAVGLNYASGALGYIAGPKAVALAAKAIAPAKQKVEKTLGRIFDSVAPKLEGLSKVKATKIANNPIAQAVAESVGKTATSSLTKAISSKIAPSNEKMAIAKMDDEKLSKLIAKIDDFTADEFQTNFLTQAPANIPPNMVQGVTDQVARLINYIQITTPPPDDSLDQPRPESKVRLKERMKGVRSVLDTDSFFEDFSKGTLSKTQIDAWKQVYPEALRQLQSVVTAEVNAIKEEGGKFSNQQKRNISLITGQSGGMYDQKAVDDFQKLYAIEAQSSVKAGGGAKVDLSSNMATPLQKTHARNRV
jgi:hypothetical protein